MCRSETSGILPYFVLTLNAATGLPLDALRRLVPSVGILLCLIECVFCYRFVKFDVLIVGTRMSLCFYFVVFMFHYFSCVIFLLSCYVLSHVRVLSL
jgi:hypothetical protein